VKAPPLDYVRPATVAEALAYLKQGGDGAMVLAGGQSLGPMLNLRLARPTLLVDISRLAELTRTATVNGTLAIGSAVIHADIEDGKAPDPCHGLLTETAATIAYRAVRNRGTIGGSLSHADPVGDWCPVLMALGASVVAASNAGERTIAVADFVEGVLTTSLRPGEIVTEIRIPRLAATARWGRYKICRKPGKFADAIAVVVMDTAAVQSRVAVAMPNHRPVLLPQAAVHLLALKGADRDGLAAFRNAARAELAALGASDALQLHILSAAAMRAAADALNRKRPQP